LNHLVQAGEPSRQAALPSASLCVKPIMTQILSIGLEAEGLQSVLMILKTGAAF